MLTSSSKTCLDLIRDTNSAKLPNPGKCFLDETSRILDRSSNSLNGFSKESCYTLPFRQRISDELLHLVEIEVLHLAALLDRGPGDPGGKDGAVSVAWTPPEPPVHVRVHGVVDALTPGDGELPSAVSRDAHGVGGHAVVGVPEGDKVVIAGVEPGEVHGQVVGLTAAVDEVDNRQRVREGLHQLDGVLVDLGVEVDVGGVPQSVELLDQGLVYPGMAMAH